MWRLDFTGDTPTTVYFSGCEYSGYGAFNGRIALFDCRGNLLVSNDDACKVGTMPELSYEMNPFDGYYYLLVDGNNASDAGAYGIAIYLAPTCSDALQNGYETDVDCGGVICDTWLPGESCALASDCLSGVCTANVCE